MAVPPRPPSTAQVQYALRLLKQQGLAAPTAEEVATMNSVEVSSLLDGLLAKRGKPVFYGNGQFSHWQKGAGEKTAAANLAPVRQRTQYTCMASSMSMCLGALGLQDCSEDTVNRVMGAAPMRGAAWEQALATAQHYGVRATLTVPATLSQVKAWTDVGKPVMIGWNPEGREWSHASVIFDVQPCPTHGFMVHVADPNCPDPEQTVRIVPKNEFYSKWYEKFPNYLVRRPALMLEREVTPEGRQVMASMKNRSTVLVDAPLTVPVSEVPVSKQAKAPVQVGPSKKNPNVMRGEAPSQRNPVVQGLIERGTSGAGKHKNKQDFDRGHARAPKHKGQKGWGAEYMTLPVEEALGAEYMQSETARFKTKEEGDKKTVDPTVNMTPEGAAEWKKQNIINRDNFKNKGAGLLPSEVAHSRAAAVDGEVAKATRMLTVAMKASRAVPFRMAEQFKAEVRAFSDAADDDFTIRLNDDASPEVLKKCEEYRAQVLGMLKALSGVALPKENGMFAAQGAEAVRLLPKINRNMDSVSEVAAFARYLDSAAWVVATKAKEAAWRVYYLTQWLDFYKTNNRPPSWDEQDEWFKHRRKMANRLPSEVADKVAKLMSRQEAILKKYVEEAGSRAVDQYDDLPKNVRDALTRVKDQETLWSDAERWLSDNRSRRASANRADLLPSEAARLRAAGLEDACWDDYEAVGMKEQGGEQVPNCVPTKKAADTFRPGDMAMWNGKRVMVLDTHGFPPRAVDVRWTESGVSGSKGEVANTKRNVPANQLTKVARYDRGPLSPDEKTELFEGNPVFADKNENPPESVLAVREQMGRQAARYSRDPYWMTAKYSGVDKNGKPFRAGERVFYYPNGKVILTGKEAEAAARDFDAARFDEDGY